MGLGYSHYLLGEFETAREYLEKGLNILLGTGAQLFLSLFYAFLAVTYFDMDNHPKALDLIHKALDCAKKNGEKSIEGLSEVHLGRITAKSQPLQKNSARESILAGIKILEQLNNKAWYAYGYLALGELYTDCGQTEKALENLKIAEQMFTEMGMDYYLAKTREVMKRL